MLGAPKLRRQANGWRRCCPWLLTAVLYAGQTTQQGIQASAGALYASTIFIGIINSISVQPIVAEKRGVMYREKAAGMYSIGPWVSGLVRSLLPAWSGSVSEWMLVSRAGHSGHAGHSIMRSVEP